MTSAPPCADNEAMPRFLVLAGLLAGLSFSAGADTLRGRVVSVADGDTVTVSDGRHVAHIIRLAGIDAPEKAQAYGKLSRQNLVRQVAGQTVEVEWRKTDKYGRQVGTIWLGGVDVNLAQVEAGLAWHYKAYADEQSADDRQHYAQAEDHARRRHIGLWRDTDPTPPWDFRQARRAGATAPPIADSGPCSCGGPARCTGSRGGHYCLTPNGKKRYR